MLKFLYFLTKNVYFFIKSTRALAYVKKNLYLCSRKNYEHGRNDQT